MGIAARALFKHFCDENPHLFKSIRVRFARPCYPGETLETLMWTTSSSRSQVVHFQVVVRERNVIVIDGGEFIYGTSSTTTTTSSSSSSKL